MYEKIIGIEGGSTDEAYPKKCSYCGERIIMAPGKNGGWVPLDTDYRGFHDCAFGKVKRLPAPPRKKLSNIPRVGFRTPPMYEWLTGKVIQIEARTHPRIYHPLWAIDLLYVKDPRDKRRQKFQLFRTRFCVDKEFALNTWIYGKLVQRHDVGTFLEDATAICLHEFEQVESKNQ